ncbi:glycogen synthase GlgA [Rhizobium sp. RCC_161_2]|uniref:glycogen synthase GlgA n=1 Tax=Rhizobium sp. RCC_161_2 TaxID=3239219 RepID=UPI0035232694
MQILSVASEVFPLIKTGGLADVTGSLPKALRSYGISTRTLVPGYPTILERVQTARKIATFELLGEQANLLAAHIGDLDVLVLHAPTLYERPGGPYLDQHGKDHTDNDRRFAALSLAGAEIATGLMEDWLPDLVHTHDWPTALTSVYLRHVKRSEIPTVLTVHNLAFQGQFPAERLAPLGLPADVYSIDCLEYYGDISFLKGGIATANALTTVSPTYAREILSEDLGMGMEGILRSRRRILRGIVNGIDDEIWDPATDPYIAANFEPGTIAQRRLNREHLLNFFGLTDDDGPIFSVVSRLTWQKGADLLPQIIPFIAESQGKLVVCGQGDGHIEEMLCDTAAAFPQTLSVHIGYDEAIAHLSHAGSDFVIQPSRFEPCGLTQLYALRYGSVPIVTRTGGLAETTIDANDAATAADAATGFQFFPPNAHELGHAIERAATAFRDQRLFRRLQLQAMKADFSWGRSARLYAALYCEFAKGKIAPDHWRDRKAG